MLYSEIIAVCSQIHTKHINTLCGQNVEFYVHVTEHRNKFLFNKTNETHEFPKFYFVKKLYMFRAFRVPNILTLLGRCHQTYKKYTNVECIEENS